MITLLGLTWYWDMQSTLNCFLTNLYSCEKDPRKVRLVIVRFIFLGCMAVVGLVGETPNGNAKLGVKTWWGVAREGHSETLHSVAREDS